MMYNIIFGFFIHTDRLVGIIPHCYRGFLLPFPWVIGIITNVFPFIFVYFPTFLQWGCITFKIRKMFLISMGTQDVAVHRKWLVIFCFAPPAAAGHPFPEDGPARSAVHWLPGGEESTCQLHQDCCERHDPGRDDPQGGACVSLSKRAGAWLLIPRSSGFESSDQRLSPPVPKGCPHPLAGLGFGLIRHGWKSVDSSSGVSKSSWQMDSSLWWDSLVVRFGHDWKLGAASVRIGVSVRGLFAAQREFSARLSVTPFSRKPFAFQTLQLHKNSEQMFQELTDQRMGFLKPHSTEYYMWGDVANGWSLTHLRQIFTWTCWEKREENCRTNGAVRERP